MQLCNNRNTIAITTTTRYIFIDAYRTYVCTYICMYVCAYVHKNYATKCIQIPNVFSQSILNFYTCSYVCTLNKILLTGYQAKLRYDERRQQRGLYICIYVRTYIFSCIMHNCVYYVYYYIIIKYGST